MPTGFIFVVMRYQSYLNTAKKIIELYKGEMPLAAWLKKYFAANKKYGSKDRKQIVALCYGYYRLGKAAKNNSIEEDILTGYFLSEPLYSDFIAAIKPQWEDLITHTVDEKVDLVQFPTKNIFPFANELSEGIDYELFCRSFLAQPKLFIRLRLYNKENTIKKLHRAKIPIIVFGDDCVGLSNNTPLDDIIETDREAVIQDYNSQQVFNFLKNIVPGKKPLRAWDCCAASGGKSILLHDVLKKHVEITVSDIRPTILFNLHKRFIQARIRNYNYFIGDLSSPNFEMPPVAIKGVKNPDIYTHYELIVMDAPCSGSGTWSRTPENLFHFNVDSITAFAERQKQMATRVVPYLEKDGLLFYITCSVFKKENEEVAYFIEKECKLQLIQMEVLKGYDKKADSMFVAVFKK
jgi:16S rRNA (cytosine967-C5)-methyltransferase